MRNHIPRTAPAPACGSTWTWARATAVLAAILDSLLLGQSKGQVQIRRQFGHQRTYHALVSGRHVATLNSNK